MPTTLGIVASQRSGSAASPIPTTGLAGWWDADDASTFTYSSGVDVSEWRDKSGNNRHFVIGGNAPPQRNKTVNGRAALWSDGGARKLETSQWAMSQPVTVIVVAQKESASGQDSVFQMYPDGRIYRPSSDEIAVWSAGGFSSGVLWGASPHVVSTLWNGASSDLDVDGAHVTGAVGSASYGGGPFRLFAEDWFGVICELLIYDRVLSTVERQQVETYLRTKWGTP